MTNEELTKRTLQVLKQSIADRGRQVRELHDRITMIACKNEDLMMAVNYLREELYQERMRNSSLLDKCMREK